MKTAMSPKTLGLLSIVALLVGGGAVYYQFQAMVDTQAKMKTLEGEVPDAQELNQRLEASNQKIAEMQLKLSHLETGVPTVAYIPTLLKELEQAGNSSQMKVTGVKPLLPVATPANEKKEKKPYDEIEIEITGRGDYGAVVRLLDQLKKFPKIVAVTQVNLSPKFFGTNTTKYEYIDTNIHIRAFVFPNKNEGTKSTVKVAQNESGGAS